MEESIGDRLKKLRKAEKLTQAALAAQVGLSQSAIGNIEAGTRGYGASVVLIAKALKTSPEFLQVVGRLTRQPSESNQPADIPFSGQVAGEHRPIPIELENNPEYPAIRRVAIKAQAGVSGFSVEYSTEDDGPPIVFRADWYKAKGYKPEKMLALRVKGESMIPSMYEGDLIVINTLSTEPKQGIPFLVSYEGEICVKRLVRDDGLWWLTSDNPDQRRYPRTKCNGGTDIIGEVVYRQTERV